MKIKYKHILFFTIQIAILSIFFGTYYLRFRSKHYNNKQEDLFFRNFNESFKGKVYKIKRYNPKDYKSTGTKFSLIYLKLEETTIKNYDLRALSKSFTFFIVKNNKAVVIADDFEMKRMQIGHHILYDGEIDTLFHYYLGDNSLPTLNLIESPLLKSDIISPYIPQSDMMPNNAVILAKWQPVIGNSSRFLAIRDITDF